MQSAVAGSGISASLITVAEPMVERGHVAAWVGVGGPDQGPNGEAEWLQVGVNAVEDGTTALYYEATRPGEEPEYVELATGVPTGKQLRVAVLEISGRPGTWRVWVSGHPVSKPIRLEASHHRLTPMAIAESWDGGAPACNRYAYRFGQVSLAAAPGGSWKKLQDAQVLQDPGYRVVQHDDGGFLALTKAPVPGAAIVSVQP